MAGSGRNGVSKWRGASAQNINAGKWPKGVDGGWKDEWKRG